MVSRKNSNNRYYFIGDYYINMMSLSKDRKFKKKEGGGDEVKRERRE